MTKQQAQIGTQPASSGGWHFMHRSSEPVTIVVIGNDGSVKHVETQSRKRGCLARRAGIERDTEQGRAVLDIMVKTQRRMPETVRLWSPTQMQHKAAARRHVPRGWDSV